jgi:hypothetical protein
MLRAAGSPAEAALALERSVRTSPDPGQRQRALWHELDLRIEGGERSLGKLFLNRREYVADAGYFQDLLEEAVTLLLGERDWAELELLREFARDKNAGPCLSRVDFILARAVSSGFLPATPSRDPVTLLDEAMAADPAGYHGLLSSHLRGKPFERLALAPDGEPPPDHQGGSGSPAPGAAPRAGDSAAYISGFFDYGLPLAAYRALTGLDDAVPEEVVLQAAGDLAASGHHAESIRLAAASRPRQGRLFHGQNERKTLHLR